MSLLQLGDKRQMGKRSGEEAHGEKPRVISASLLCTTGCAKDINSVQLLIEQMGRTRAERASQNGG